MRLHGRDRDARRQQQVALVERPLEHDRPLDQVRHLVELIHRVDPLTALVEPLGDQLAPLGGVGDHAHAADVLQVGRRRADPSLAAQEPVAARLHAGAHAEQLDVHGLLIELADQPAHRPGEAPAVPAHRLRELDPADHSGNDLAQQLGGRRGRLLGGHPQEPVPLLQLARRHAVLACEPGARLLGRIDLRPPLLTTHGRPLGGHAQRAHDQPPRRHMDVDLCRFQPGVGKRLRRQLWQLRLRLAAGGGGELLAADLEQQVRRRPHPPSSGRPASPVRACAGCTPAGR